MADPDNVSLALQGLAIRKKKESTVTVAKDNQKSPLLRLPAEIRNIIYDYVMEDNHWSYPHNGGVVKTKASAVSKSQMSQTPQLTETIRNDYALAMTLVCRQLYLETRLYPFDTTIFHAEICNTGHSGHFLSLGIKPAPQHAIRGPPECKFARRPRRTCCASTTRRWRPAALSELHVKFQREDEHVFAYMARVKKVLEKNGVNVAITWP
ncbi:hypothetical protein P171DRAFT_489202 [Karstenula rhodostoma CBS 690.94]|uniref:DUF7730 domain-containing protein n=1 Tax=Karstenula rhodostoma CBS 690.94 TaxID=1392251 RepID=A0A9P4PCC9_9PLEO|nr:hypothetical protein P171DRAFT_489202 [Karstenula rhodostoma CBS 690.94]